MQATYRALQKLVQQFPKFWSCKSVEGQESTPAVYVNVGYTAVCRDHIGHPPRLNSFLTSHYSVTQHTFDDDEAFMNNYRP
jgi:hypothetical protein